MAEDLRQEWGTPRAVFEELRREHAFTVDVCASPLNRKLDRYLTKADDALACSWAGERVFCNPPFVSIDPWLGHALEADLAYFLLPARTFNAWRARWAPQAARREWYIGRMRFEPPPGVKPTSVPFPVVGLLFGGDRGPDAYRDAISGKRLDIK